MTWLGALGWLIAAWLMLSFVLTVAIACIGCRYNTREHRAMRQRERDRARRNAFERSAAFRELTAAPRG